MTDTPAPSLWLPAPARAKHDEPITAEDWERRERAWKAAEETIAKVFGERDAAAAFGQMIQRGLAIQAELREQEQWAKVRADHDARLEAIFGHMSRDEVRALWDAVGDDSFAHGVYDCADIHGYLNLIDDGDYCRV